MSAWSFENPGLGDVATFRSRAQLLNSAASDYRGAATRFSTIGSSTVETWKGSAAAAFRDRVTSSKPAFDVLAGWADAEASAHSVYASGLEQIKDKHRALMVEREQSESDLAHAHSRLRTLREHEDSPWAPMSTALQEQQVSSFEYSASNAQHRLAGVHQRTMELVTDREALDRRFVNAVDKAVPFALRPSSTTAAFGSAAGLSSINLLDMLSKLSPAELKLWTEQNPDLVKKLQTDPPDPTKVAAWWAALGGGAAIGTLSAAQRALAEGLPDVIGNLEGVSYTARDVANRTVILRDYRELCFSDPKLEERNQALKAVMDAMGDPATNKPPRQVISLLLDDPPKAAISYGNLDTAENVSYLIPGMGSTVEGSMKGWLGAAKNLYNEQSTVTGSSLATVAWIGYETPPVPDWDNKDLGVLHGDSARDGATRLETALNGLHAARGGNPPYLGVVAHSYGTTTASLALENVKVDSFTMVGSAGIETSIHNVDDLKVPSGEVYVTKAAKDPWAGTGQTFSGREDPRMEHFGATVFSSEGGGDLHGTTAHDTTLHSKANPDAYGYLDAKTQSLHNAALASTGQGDLIETIPNEVPPTYTPGVY